MKKIIILFMGFIVTTAFAGGKHDQRIKEYSNELNKAKVEFLKKVSKKNFTKVLQNFDTAIYAADTRMFKETSAMGHTESGIFNQKWKTEELSFFKNSNDVRIKLNEFPDAKFGDLITIKTCFTKPNPEDNCIHLNSSD